MNRRFVRCVKCGEVELSSNEYDRQMMNAWAEWFCPRCWAFASFTKDLTPCLDINCDGWLDMEKGTDICDTCGQSQQAIYAEALEMFGDEYDPESEK